MAYMKEYPSLEGVIKDLEKRVRDLEFAPPKEPSFEEIKVQTINPQTKASGPAFGDMRIEGQPIVRSMGVDGGSSVLWRRIVNTSAGLKGQWFDGSANRWKDIGFFVMNENSPGGGPTAYSIPRPCGCTCVDDLEAGSE